MPKEKKRPMLDYKEIIEDPNSAVKVELVNNDVYNWIVYFDGPNDTPFEGLKFRASVHLKVVHTILYWAVG